MLTLCFYQLIPSKAINDATKENEEIFFAISKQTYSIQAAVCIVVSLHVILESK
jgi:hypothetical protein